MRKVWKWIIGILIGLVAVAVVVGAFLMVRNRTFLTVNFRPMMYGNWQPQPKAQGIPNVQGTPNAPGGPNAPGAPNGFNGQKGPMMPNGFNGRHNPMNGWGEREPMMGRGGFSHFGRFMPFGMFGMGFFFLVGLLHLVFPLGVLALVAFIFYQMGKRAGLNSVKYQTPPPSEPAPVEIPARSRKVAKS